MADIDIIVTRWYKVPTQSSGTNFGKRPVSKDCAYSGKGHRFCVSWVLRGSVGVSGSQNQPISESSLWKTSPKHFELLEHFCKPRLQKAFGLNDFQRKGTHKIEVYLSINPHAWFELNLCSILILWYCHDFILICLMYLQCIIFLI